MSTERRDVAAAFGRISTGVAIVTTLDGQQPHGSTGMAWAEHPEPPLLLTTLDRSARTLELIEASGSFGISMLDAAQADLTWKFAAKADRFAGVSITLGPTRGVPLIDGSVALLECDLEASYPFGGHDIVVGRVLWCSASDRPDASPLLHYRGKLWAVQGRDA